jgi:uncharacterized RDD family membrane protein YckC
VAAVSRRAGVGRRLAASLYEALLLAALALVAGFALLPVLGTAPSPPADGHALPLLGPAGRAVSFASLFVVLGAYCVWGWGGGRRTLPMKTWRIAMETASGSRVSVPRAALRYVAWWIGPAFAVTAYAGSWSLGYDRWAWVLLALNYAWALVNADRQFLHDRVAGTRLVVGS